MKCKYCGKNLIEGAKYCVYCAKPVEEESEIKKEQEKENNQAILGVIIVISIIIASIIGAVLIYKFLISKPNKKVDNNINNNNTNITPIEPEKTIPNITKEEAKAIIDKYYFAISSNDNLFTVSLDDNTKKSIALRNISSDIKEVPCEEISGYSLSDGVCINNEKGNTTQGRTIDYDILNNKYKYLFGKSNEISKETIKDINNVTTWEYDEIKNTFLEVFVITGFEGIPSYTTYAVKDFAQNKEELVINVGYVNIAPKELNGEYVLSTIIGGEEVTYTEEQTKEPNFEQEFLNKYLDKLDTYEFIFKYEDDHYVLKNMRKI